MKEFINCLIERNYQNRIIGFIENGSWAPAVIKVASEILSSMKNIKILEEKISIKSALQDNSPIEKMADEIAQDIKNK